MFIRSTLQRVRSAITEIGREYATKAVTRTTGPLQRWVQNDMCGPCGTWNCTNRPVLLGGVMMRDRYSTKAKGDEELKNFLAEEIKTETKNRRGGPLPTTLDGFSIKTDRSDVTLTKNLNDESLIITLNVNHTVDADFNEEASPKTDKEPPEMRSRPNFEVDIVKGGQTIKFSCSYLQEPTPEELQQDEYQDAFTINEISIYQGEWNEKIYAVAGDILDGYLYDLFMNMLEDRGVSNEFVDKLSDFCSDYEHDLYVGFLEKLQNYLSSK